jgi:PKD repeat protein
MSINVGQWVQFSGTESSTGANYPLSYLWQFGAGSGIADSNLKEPGPVRFDNPGTYTVSFRVTDSTGIYDPTPATRVIVVGMNTTRIPRTGWKVAYSDSEEPSYWRGANAIDGNANTFWHTKWSSGSAAYPHEIQIDLGQTYQINGFCYLPRQDGNVNGTIKQYEFYLSSDGVAWGSSIAAGAFGSGTSAKEVLFAQKAGRYVRLRALSEVNGNPWASMAELDVFGLLPPDGVIDTPSTSVSINTGQRVQFSGSGANGNYPLSYLWQFGAGSGIPDSTLKDPGLVQFNIPGIYTVSLTVTDCTGMTDPTPATRIIVVGMNAAQISKTGWKVIYSDSEEPSYWRAANAIDGNANTFWHTKWIGGSTAYPHEIQIDLGKTFQINGFRYLPRQDGSVNGTIKKYEFYVSEDGVNWGSWIATGTFESGTTVKEVIFAPKAGRFVHLRALSEVNGNPWASVAEIDIIGF